MIGSFGAPELLVDFFIALIVFHPSTLSKLSRPAGEAIREARDALNDRKKISVLARPRLAMPQMAKTAIEHNRDLQIPALKR